MGLKKSGKARRKKKTQPMKPKEKKLAPIECLIDMLSR